MNNYLICNININKEEGSAILYLGYLIKKLNKLFGEQLKGLKTYKMPGTPSVGTVCPTDKNEVVSKEQHEKYRNGVGMLLYLMKNTRLDISNSMMGLTILNDGPTGNVMKEMKRVIKYVLETGNKGLKMTPHKKENIRDIFVYSESDFSGNKESRIRVSGLFILLNDAPISWRSKAQRSVKLSSSESEYVALSEAAKELKFIWMLLKSIILEFKLPITVRVDNVGAIFMPGNVTTSNRTKRVDTRYRFVNKFVEEGFGEIIFVKTRYNMADIFTNNTIDDIVNFHHNKMAKEIKNQTGRVLESV